MVMSSTISKFRFLENGYDIMTSMFYGEISSGIVESSEAVMHLISCLNSKLIQNYTELNKLQY